MAEHYSPASIAELRRRFLEAGGCPHCWPLEPDDQDIDHRPDRDPPSVLPRLGVSTGELEAIAAASRPGEPA